MISIWAAIVRGSAPTAIKVVVAFRSLEIIKPALAAKHIVTSESSESVPTGPAINLVTTRPAPQPSGRGVTSYISEDDVLTCPAARIVGAPARSYSVIASSAVERVTRALPTKDILTSGTTNRVCSTKSLNDVVTSAGLNDVIG